MSVGMNFMNLAIFSFTFVLLTSNAAREEGSLADAKIQKKRKKEEKPFSQIKH
jgi:hypothetical protein